MKTFLPIRNAALTALLFLLAAQAIAQPKFINKIPIPPLIDAANGTINLEMRVTRHKYNPGDPSDVMLNGTVNQSTGLTAFAYNVAGSSTMSLLGPTLKWHTYGRTVIHVKNLIGVPTTTHWHGAELPAQMDGGPHQGIAPLDTWTAPDFVVLDSACTMWYHPHYHDETLPQVQMGLSGMIYVEQPDDPIRNTLPHTYGIDDIPVIIGDLGTKLDTIYNVVNLDTLKGKRPYNIVNGVTNPYVEVPAHLVRLRILNGSTRKGIVFGFSDSYDTLTSNLNSFYQIATDGGYTLKPNTLKSILNGPGSRDEIVLDLSKYKDGDKLYLRNLKWRLPKSVVGSPLVPPTPGGGGQDTTMGEAFLQLRVMADGHFPGYAPVTAPFKPFTTVWSPGLADPSNVTVHRLKQLKIVSDTTRTVIPNWNHTTDSLKVKIENGFTIDGTSFDEHRIDDIVCVGSREIWTIDNTTPIAHPFHIHKIQFRILDITDASGKLVNLEARGLNGPKDDVLVLPGWKLRFLAQFDDYPSPVDHDYAYMYHCHILTHEDSEGGGMMHQFVVTNDAPCFTSSFETAGGRPSMQLYPNPSAGTLLLKGQSAKPSTVSILDVQGRRIRQQQLAAFEGDAAIDVDGLSNGFYMVEWRTYKGAVTKKLVVQR